MITDYVAIGKAVLARLEAQRVAAGAVQHGEHHYDINDINDQTTTCDRNPDLAAREAALSFVNRAGARLVSPCPGCHPDAPAGAQFLVLVPQANDVAEFRASLAVLKISCPVVVRSEPLAHLPVRCAHVGEP